MGHRQQNIGSFLRLVERIDRGVARGVGKVVIDAIAVNRRLAALQIGRIRQNDVGIGRGVGRQHVHGDDKLHLRRSENLLPPGVRIIVTHRVGGVDEQRAGAIGFAAEHQLAVHRFLQTGVGHDRQGDVRLAGGLLLSRPRPGPAGMAVREILAVGECANDHFGERHAGKHGQRRRNLAAASMDFVHARRFVMKLAAHDPAARLVKAAGQGLQHGLHASKHQDAVVACAMPAGIDDRRAGGPEFVGDSSNCRGVDPGRARRPFGREVADLQHLGLHHGDGWLAIDLQAFRGDERGLHGLAVRVVKIVVAEGDEGADLG